MYNRLPYQVLLSAVCVMVLVFGGVGCKTDDSGSSSGFDIGTTPPPAGPGTANPDGLPDIDQDRILFPQGGDSGGLQTIYFDFDSSQLRADALATLRENANLIKRVPGVVIQVAGHCDERGTQEYNFALGERRALVVREHLMQLGVNGGRLLTITYGEEFPQVAGNNEAAYAKNRRAEFNRGHAQ